MAIAKPFAVNARHIALEHSLSPLCQAYAYMFLSLDIDLCSGIVKD